MAINLETYFSEKFFHFPRNVFTLVTTFMCLAFHIFEILNFLLFIGIDLREPY